MPRQGTHVSKHATHPYLIYLADVNRLTSPMTKAAHRVYRNDDVFRILVQHCAKPTLVSLMGIEQIGTIFDTCVKELYREVHYEVIQHKTRDTPRRAQYLDAVIQIKADSGSQNVPKLAVPGRTTEEDRDGPCTPNGANFLRLKCPNLKLITRHETEQSGDRYTIILEKGKQSGTVRFHQHIDIVPELSVRMVSTPVITMPALWRGWTIKHTVGLTVSGVGGTTGIWDDDMKALLQDKDRMDRRVTELQTGWLPFTLSELSEIVTSRSPGQNSVSRISSTVEPFTIDQLRQFLLMAGKNLFQLNLHTQPSPSKITPTDLPAIVNLVRTQCPRLSELRLPMNFARGGVRFTDEDIGIPLLGGASGRGKIRKLSILGYNLDRSYHGLDKICVWNFARNLACLLAPDFEFTLTDGPTIPPSSIYNTQEGMPILGWYGVRSDLTRAIKFFQRLGPILEPHFATSSLNHLGLMEFDQIEELRYSNSGQPIPIKPKQTWSYGTKRSYDDFESDYDPDDQPAEYERYGHERHDSPSRGCQQS